MVSRCCALHCRINWFFFSLPPGPTFPLQLDDMNLDSGAQRTRVTELERKQKNFDKVCEAFSSVDIYTSLSAVLTLLICVKISDRFNQDLKNSCQCAM